MVADHPDQGWCLLCNGVIAFDGGGELLQHASPRALRTRRDHGGRALTGITFTETETESATHPN
jgi:hypothetical protein